MSIITTECAGVLLAVLASAGCTSSQQSEAQEGAVAALVRDYSAPPGAPYTAEEVRVVSSAGHVLAGTLTLPSRDIEQVPAVVTITGSSRQDRDHNQPDGGDYRIFRQLADALGRQGVAVLRMDDRGVGQSTGDFDSSTSADRAEDIRDGIAYLRGHQEIDPSRIVLVGMSEGGLIAPMIAATDTLLSGIVLLGAPASSGTEVMQQQARYAISQDSSIAPEHRDSIFRAEYDAFLAGPGSQEWFSFFLAYDPISTARQVRNVPVLILQGSTDRHIPAGDAEKLAAAFRGAGNSDVTMEVLPGVNHILLRDADGNPANYSSLSSFAVEPEILDRIAEWVVTRLAR